MKQVSDSSIFYEFSTLFDHQSTHPVTIRFGPYEGNGPDEFVALKNLVRVLAARHQELLKDDRAIFMSNGDWEELIICKMFLAAISTRVQYPGEAPS